MANPKMTPEQIEDFIKMHDAAIPLGIKFSQQIIVDADKRDDPKTQATFSILVAELALQNLVTAFVMNRHPAGSKSGHEELRIRYDGIREAAFQRWQKPDLKFMGGENA